MRTPVHEETTTLTNQRTDDDLMHAWITASTSDNRPGAETERPQALTYYGPGMATVLLTGMSGAGKSTVLAELSRRGVVTVDTDYDGWVLPDGTWDEPRMSDLLSAHRDLVVSGTVDNQGRFYDRFAHVVLLSAPLDVLLERVSRRTTNPYGASAAERAEIAHYVATVEPLLRAGASVELDGRLPVDELADALERLVLRS